MYIEMLETAVSELRGIKTEEEIEPRISLKVSAFIPGGVYERCYAEAECLQKDSIGKKP